MPKYQIYEIMTASKILGEIEAATKEEAIEKAWKDDAICNKMGVSLCWSCADEVELSDVNELEAEELKGGE